MSERKCIYEWRLCTVHLGEEIWKDIPGHDGLYQISNRGRPKSLARMKRIRNGGLQPMPERMLAIGINSNGQLFVNLWKDNKFKSPLINRLVLLAFVGPCPEGMECRHFPDRDRTHNCQENLLWGTKSQNQQDRVFHGTDSRGEKHWNSKLVASQVLEIRRRLLTGEDPYKLAYEFDVSDGTIRDIRSRRSWSHI